MESHTQVNHSEATLDPPGSVAVIGGGPLGLEAALYGRFLGYEVTVFEAKGLVSSWKDLAEEPIPMMPDHCVSPLARSALDAQQSQSGPQTAPLTVGEWIDRVWEPLAETDLLRGRVRCPANVIEIEHVSPEGDHDEGEMQPSKDEAEGGPVSDQDAPREITSEEAELEPDFRLATDDGRSEIFEAVILATGAEPDGIKLKLENSADGASVDYLYRIRWGTTGNPEADYLGGLKQIVSLFAELRGRPDLDLYRPLRG